MSTTTTTSTTPSPPDPRETLYRNVAIGAVIVCPIMILIPPRKLDIYTVALAAGFFAGSNHLVSHYARTSIAQRFVTRVDSMLNDELPPRAMETRRLLKEEREERRNAELLASTASKVDAPDNTSVLAEVRKKEAQDKERGLLNKVWMGNEGADWKAKRDQRERDALEEGRGYGGLIMDQIWEVWSWGKDQVVEVKEIDEKVVQEKKEGKKK